jgi:hypothetical protein
MGVTKSSRSMMIGVGMLVTTDGKAFRPIKSYIDPFITISLTQQHPASTNIFSNEFVEVLPFAISLIANPSPIAG